MPEIGGLTFWMLLPLAPLALLLAIGAIQGLSLIVTAVAAMREERRIHALVVDPDVPPVSAPGAGSGTDPSNPFAAPGSSGGAGYLASQNRAIAGRGFRHLGAGRDARKAEPTVRYDLWISADRRVFASLCEGRVGKIPVRGTILNSYLGGDRVLTTVDRTIPETDVTGRAEWRRVPGASLDDLLDAHLAWVESQLTPAVPYGPDPTGDSDGRRRGRVERMVASADARFRDEERERWSYTPRGAVRYAWLSHRKAVAEVKRGARARSLPARQRATAGGEPRWIGALGLVSMMMIVVPFAMRFTQPVEPNRPVMLFRTGLIGAGLLGSLVVALARAGRKRRGVVRP